MRLPTTPFYSEKITMRFKAFLLNEAGAELAEYAVGAALLVAIAIVVHTVLGQAIVDENSGVAAQIEAAAGAPFVPQ